MSQDTQAERNLRAGSAAILAGAAAGGSAIQLHDVIQGMLSLAVMSPGWCPKMADMVAAAVMVSLVQHIGTRRAHELVDLVDKAGAGDNFA